tara:strand:+ start:652 stop:1245 length:594 start_codon:yes stop_codon:yes gene_type:complete
MIQPTKKVNKRKKVILLISIVFAVVVIAAFLAYAWKTQLGIFGYYPFGRAENESINYDEPSQEELDAGETIKSDTVNNPPSTKPDNQQSSSDDDTDNSNTNNTVTMTISSAQQFESVVRIRTNIEELSSSGMCTLSMASSTGATYSQSSGVQPLTSYSTCKGFDINIGDLSPGTWDILINYSNGSVKGQASTEITIE